MDPLAQLKDIHLPDPINHYPLAYGWWIVALLLITLVITLSYQLLKKRRLNRAKKQAIIYLKTNELTDDAIIATIKWACLQYFPRQQIAQLFGKSLSEFLRLQLPDKHQERLMSVITPAIERQYQRSTEASEVTEHSALNNAAILWLTHALPPKAQRISRSRLNSKNNDSLAVEHTEAQQ